MGGLVPVALNRPAADDVETLSDSVDDGVAMVMGTGSGERCGDPELGTRCRNPGGGDSKTER